MLKVSTLSYNKELDRYCIGTIDLHCGQCFQVDNNGEWQDVRIEMGAKGWYLIGATKSIDEIYNEQIQVRIDM